MTDLEVLAGSTSVSINVSLEVLSTGAPQTGLVYNSSGLTAYYSFTGANTASVAIPLVTRTTGGVWSSGGFVEVDASHNQMPGVYRLDIPNLALAASKGREVDIVITGFSGMATKVVKIELTAVDNQNAV